MQSNTITLSVNHDNDDGTTATIPYTFSRYEEFQNRSQYIESNHTLALRNMLGLYRTPPKVSGNFRGTAKSSVKFTKDFSVPGVDASSEIIVPGICEVSFSLPVGVTAAESKEIRMAMVALLQDDTVMVSLTDQLMV